MSEDVKKLVEEIGQTFESFKEKNDERIKQIEKGAEDIVTKEHVDRINVDLGALTAKHDQVVKDLEKLASLKVSNDPKQDPDKIAHKEAFFGGFVRKGRDDGLSDLQQKAMNITTAADGGYAVPEELDRDILSRLQDKGGMRSLARSITVSTSDYKKLVNIHGTASGWVGEATARTATSSPQLAEVAAVMGEIYAYPEVTQQGLDDIFFDVESFLAEEIAEEFAIQEAQAFVDGNGTNKPKGFLAYTLSTSADGARTFGQVQKIATGVAGAFKTTSATVSPADDFLDLVYSMKAGHRQNGVWLMNSLTLAEVRKFKDNDGAYIWRPGIEGGQPSTVLGYRVEADEAMPDVANAVASIAFGDWQRAYYIVDRIGTRMLRDPFTNKPYVGFYTTKRVGGMLVDDNAVKVLVTEL